MIAAVETARPLVFLHVPKTAGTSFIELLSRNFAAGEVLRVTDIHRPVSEIAGDIDVALAEGKRLICGHFPYAAVAHLHGEVDIVTMLRDPVARIVSLYKFWRSREPGSAGGSASEFACRIARALPFEEFVACAHPLIVSATSDETCKALVGHASQAPGGLDPVERFQIARMTLDGVAFGLVEDMPLSMRLLSRRLRLNLLDDVHVNRTDHLPGLEVSAAARAAIMANNQGDAMLYSHARRRMRHMAEQAEIAELHGEIGDLALTAMQADDQGRFHWDAGMRLSGTDWHEREVLSDGSYYRFTSAPHSIAYLPNPLAGRRGTLSVEALFFNMSGLLDATGPVSPADSMEFLVNGAPAATRARRLGETGAVFDVDIKGTAAEAPFLTVMLRSLYGVSPSLFGSPDTRSLAAAIRSMRLSPG